MNILRIVLLIFIIPNVLYADCSFRTGNYTKELANPKFLENIEIDIPKSAKFAKNFFKIITVPTQNIPPKLKKKFKALITAKYPFGFCTYRGTVKQNGDWRDHIDFNKDGNTVRSLNVKLEEGNILNMVKFKLLLPETRNDLHEVLGALLLKEIGFISPETTQINTMVNGVSNIMLFQAGATKEMLEKNNRREGPLFEGDETILWSYKDYENFDLSSLALARMSNAKWFLKGSSSENISLNSFARLQHEYLRSEADADTRNLFPNGLDNKVFQEYFLYLLSMNGAHGLAGHNRRFYFNIFSKNFEPVYYDGDLTLDKPFSYNDVFFDLIHFSREHEYSNKFTNLKNSNSLLKKFQDRALVSDEAATKFFFTSLNQIEKNFDRVLEVLSNQSSSKMINAFENTHQNRVERFFKNQIDYALEQDVVIDLAKVDGKYLGYLRNGLKFALSRENLAAIISKNTLSDVRTIYLPKKENSFIVNTLKKPLQSLGLLGEIEHSKGLQINIDKPKKIISFIQSQPTDWALIKNTNLENWTIEFLGVQENFPRREIYEQRFNYRGMTGCLNFYDTIFNATKISVDSGGCEDSLNIVNSTGNLEQINVKNAFSDGVDIDFSKIEINKLIVENAGNDCFDVSGGIYVITQSDFFNCGDKGASVGERSRVQFGELNVRNSNIGISSKDSSIVSINMATIASVDLCYEVFQKKQEFGGAFLEAESFYCLGNGLVDDNSMGEISLK